MQRRYKARHRYQYRKVNSARTRSSGCTWITGAVGLDAQSGGKLDLTPDAVLARVKRTEETNPTTPGWSLVDLRLAAARLGVKFEIRSGQGWAGVRRAKKEGLYVVLQGDSDRFVGGCSGLFDGDHCVGIPPEDSIGTDWIIDDPICPTRTREPEAELRRYAEKFAPTIQFGVFVNPVPFEEAAMSFPLYSTGGKQRSFKAGTPVYNQPGDAAAVSAIKDPTIIYRLVAQDAREDEDVKWYLLDGGGDEKKMGWVKA